MNAMAKPRLFLFMILGLSLHSMTAQGQYHRISLDEKVRLSDLIVVGTAIEMNEYPPFSTATRRAIINVDQMLKGVKPDGPITIGYRSGDQIYDVNNNEYVRLIQDPIEIGKPCIYFLRKSVSQAFAPVNWQHGIISIDNDNVTDPRWPSDEVGMLYRHHIRLVKSAPKNDPWDFRAVIGLNEALTHIRSAIAVVEHEKDLGQMSINGAPTRIVWEVGEKRYRLLIRVPRRADCPSFDVTRVSAVMNAKPSDPIRADGPCIGETAPMSVDPISVIDQLVLSFPRTKQTGDPASVELVIDGQKREFCIDDSAGCKSDSIAIRCAACGSSDTRPHNTMMSAYTNRPCGFTPDPLPIIDHNAEKPDLRRHCNTCEFDW